jgi:hypothetical protein
VQRRSERRIKKSYLVFQNVDDPKFLGVITNVSKNGFCIDSKEELKVHGIHTFLIAVKDEVYSVRGEVKWLTKAKRAFTEYIPFKIGVRTVEIPVQFLNYLEYSKYHIRQNLQAKIEPMKSLTYMS